MPLPKGKEMMSFREFYCYRRKTMGYTRIPAAGVRFGCFSLPHAKEARSAHKPSSLIDVPPG